MPTPTKKNRRKTQPKETSGSPAARRRASTLPTPASVARDAVDQHLSFTDAFPLPGVLVILGFQGEGKTSLAYWLMDEYHRRTHGRIVGAVYKGPPKMREWLPDWVSRPHTIQQIPESAVVLVTEAHRYAGARRSTSTENLELSHLAAVARQRNSIIIFDTHHSRKLDLLDIGEAKRVIYKKPSMGQVMIERPEVKPFTYRALNAFAKAKGDSRKLAYINDLQDLRFGMVQVKQASFWREELSTAMKDF